VRLPTFALRVLTLSLMHSLISVAAPVESRIFVPPALPTLALSTHYRVKVEGMEVPTHQVTVNPTSQYRDIPAEGAMAQFDFVGEVTVEIDLARPVSGVVVRPLSRNIPVEVRGQTVSFRLSQPGPLVIEFNGQQRLPLMLFTNRPDEAPPLPDDPQVLFFPAGDHAPGRITVGTGQTLYLAPGALVRGYIAVENAENVRIGGRGVLYGGDISREEAGDHKFVNITSSRDVHLSGIVLLDGFGWNVRVLNSTEVDVENIKIVGWRRNTDGINPVSSRRVRIRQNFIKGQDDGVSIKGNAVHHPEVRDILVEGNVFWQYFMRSIVVGGEMAQIRRVANIVIRDNDVLHSSYNPLHPRDAALSVWNVDSATITDVLFENIRVENCHRLVRIGVAVNKHSRDDVRGRIEGIEFRDIVAHNGPAIIEITGYGENHDVADIRFRNLLINGRPITGADQCFLVLNEFVSGIDFQ
jgi:hypothetical protein